MMPLVRVASQHAADSTGLSVSSAACVAREQAGAAETTVKELSRECSATASHIDGSAQQQGRRSGHQEHRHQHQQTQQEQLEQQQKREHPEHEQADQIQEGECQQQQQGGKRRRVCSGCNRPCSVCYCSIIQGRDLSLSEQDICSIVNRVIVFMHPLEKKRKNGSVRVLQKLVKGIEIWPHRRPGCCPFAPEQQQQEQQEDGQRNVVIQCAERAPCVSETVACIKGPEEACATNYRVEGAREISHKEEQQVHQQREPQREQQPQQHLCTRDGAAACDTSRMVLLFPTESSLALGVGSLPVRLPVTLVAIDGTWKEAKEMFSASPWLQQLPAVHLPITSYDAGVGSAAPVAGTVTFGADVAASSDSSSSRDSVQALRVSGAYGMIRTPPAKVAASGGVCTAEAVAQALSILGRWGRSGSSSLLQIGETTRETLHRIVSLQQRMRDEKSDRNAKT